LCFLVSGIFCKDFKTREEYGFLENTPVEGTVNSMEQKTRVFVKDVQEFHLRLSGSPEQMISLSIEPFKS
jgi:hypothetical protein